MPTEKAMALASPRVPHGREEEMIAREQAALERPGNLRAAQALATAHRYLDDPIPAPCRLDHNLHGPAVGLVLHAEVAENAGAARRRGRAAPHGRRRRSPPPRSRPG